MAAASKIHPVDRCNEEVVPAAILPYTCSSITVFGGKYEGGCIVNGPDDAVGDCLGK